MNAIKLGIAEKGSIREIRDRRNRRDETIVKASNLFECLLLMFLGFLRVGGRGGVLILDFVSPLQL